MHGKLPELPYVQLKLPGYGKFYKSKTIGLKVKMTFKDLKDLKDYWFKSLLQVKDYWFKIKSDGNMHGKLPELPYVQLKLPGYGKFFLSCMASGAFKWHLSFASSRHSMFSYRSNCWAKWPTWAFNHVQGSGQLPWLQDCTCHSNHSLSAHVFRPTEETFLPSIYIIIQNHIKTKTWYIGSSLYYFYITYFCDWHWKIQ